MTTQRYCPVELSPKYLDVPVVETFGHWVTQFLDVGSPHSSFEQKLVQVLVILSPNVIIGDEGQFKDNTHVISIF